LVGYLTQQQINNPSPDKHPRQPRQQTHLTLESGKRLHFICRNT
jgi:hypothetical protein